MSRRQVQAEQTRREVLAAARARFAATGYRATTVKDVAAAAGVSVQTVYDSIGAKRDLVLALDAELDAAAGVAAITAGAAGGPAALLAVPAAVTRAVLEHGAGVVRACLAGAADDAELAAAVERRRARHRALTAELAASLAALGSIPAGASGLVAATVAALSDPAYGLVLLDAYGWSLDRVEAFMAATARTTVLGDLEQARHL